MEDLKRCKEDWEASLLESFWEMVKAPDGDFGVLAPFPNPAMIPLVWT